MLASELTILSRMKLRRLARENGYFCIQCEYNATVTPLPKRSRSRAGRRLLGRYFLYRLRDEGNTVPSPENQVSRRGRDEITVHPRSLTGVTSFLSRGVEAPETQRELGWVVDMGSWEGLVQFRVRSSKEEPGEVFHSVRHHDHWFFIDLADHERKRAFGLLRYVFEVQGPATSAAARS